MTKITLSSKVERRLQDETKGFDIRCAIIEPERGKIELCAFVKSEATGKGIKFREPPKDAASHVESIKAKIEKADWAVTK